MPENLYRDLPARTFWRSGVAEVEGAFDPDTYTKKWQIPRKMPIATACSCFAQYRSQSPGPWL